MTEAIGPRAVETILAARHVGKAFDGRQVLADISASVAPIKGRIGYVPQQHELAPILTGAQQLALTASLYRNWDHELIARLAKEWEVPLDRRISALSGGERQKISMLLALGHRPDLLVLAAKQLQLSESDIAKLLKKKWEDEP